MAKFGLTTKLFRNTRCIFNFWRNFWRDVYCTVLYHFSTRVWTCFWQSKLSSFDLSCISRINDYPAYIFIRINKFHKFHQLLMYRNVATEMSRDRNGSDRKVVYPLCITSSNFESDCFCRFYAFLKWGGANIYFIKEGQLKGWDPMLQIALDAITVIGSNLMLVVINKSALYNLSWLWSTKNYESAQVKNEKVNNINAKHQTQ